MVEAPFALLEKQMEVGLRDAVVGTQVTLGLAPEVLDAIDVVTRAGESLGMVDPLMTKVRDVEHVVGAETAGVDNALGPDALTDDPKQCWRLGIWDPDRVDQSAPLEQAEDRHLAGRPSAAFAFACATEIALIDLDLTGEKGRLTGNVLRDQLSKLMIKQHGSVAVDNQQFSRRGGRHTCDEQHDQRPLNTREQPAPPPRHIYLTNITFLSYLCQPLREYLAGRGTAVVVPNIPRRLRSAPFDADVYKGRNSIERAPYRINDRRAISIRYDKRARDFSSASALPRRYAMASMRPPGLEIGVLSAREPSSSSENEWPNIHRKRAGSRCRLFRGTMVCRFGHSRLNNCFLTKIRLLHVYSSKRFAEGGV